MGTIGGQPDTPEVRAMFLAQATLGMCSAATLAELSDAGESTDEDALKDILDFKPEDLIIEIKKLPKETQFNLLSTPLIQAGIRASLDDDGTLDPDVYASVYGECPPYATTCSNTAYV